MLRDLVDFIFALWREWVPLLTGGSIIALLSLWQILTRKPVPRNLEWLVVGLTLLFAAFLSWRREWLRSDIRLITVSPEKLIEPFEGRTNIHAGIYIKPYIGKRIKLVGTVREVSTWGLFGFVHLSAKGVQFTGLTMRWKVAEFALLAQEGVPISVTGRIKEIGHMGIQLVGLELIKVEAEADQTKSVSSEE